MFDDMHHYIRLAKEECSPGMQLEAGAPWRYLEIRAGVEPTAWGWSNKKLHHNSFT